MNADEKSRDRSETTDFVKFRHKQFTISTTLNNIEGSAISIEALDNGSYQEYKNVFTTNNTAFRDRKPTLIFNMFKTLSSDEDKSDITITTLMTEDNALIIQLTLNTKYDDSKFEFRLTPIKQDINSVFRLIAMLQNENKELKQRIIKLENKKSWTSLDQPIALGTLNFNVCNQPQHFDMNIDEKYDEVLVNVVLRSGGEKPNAWYHVDLWTLTGDNESHKNMKRIRGYHYYQSAISFNSENMWFPVKNDKKLYYFIKDTVHSNCHAGEVQIVGYR